MQQQQSGIDRYAPIAQRREGIAYLMAEGNLDVPCSRYGYDTATCAPVAWRLAYIVSTVNGDPITVDGLDHAMSLVVNDHDDVAYVIRKYGHRQYR